MFRIVTVAREFGSGGGAIAQMLAGRMGWKLLDRCLVEKIAESARIEPQVVEKFDERPDPWFDRMAEVFWQFPGLRGYMAGPVPGRFDGEVAAQLTRRLIEEAVEIGHCVIVGRGSQCLLPAARRHLSCVRLRSAQPAAGASAPPGLAAIRVRGGEEVGSGRCHPCRLCPRPVW